MNTKEIKAAVKYWEITAKRDFETMNGLFKIKRYPESLFYGHIVLEKIIKALVVKVQRDNPPYTHDLVRLIAITKINLGKEEIEL